ncbi:hypothetical protein B566_EDAN017487, partial [Ephemera danica]
MHTLWSWMTSSSCSIPEGGLVCPAWVPSAYCNHCSKRHRSLSSCCQLRNFKLRYITGDLFELYGDSSIVHCVGSDLLMKKGFAANIRERFGHITFLKEQGKCVGEVATLPLNESSYIFYLVTKQRSFDKPNIGAGRDQIPWKKVQWIIRSAFAETDIQIDIYTLPHTEAPIHESTLPIPPSQETTPSRWYEKARSPKSNQTKMSFTPNAQTKSSVNGEPAQQGTPSDGETNMSSGNQQQILSGAHLITPRGLPRRDDASPSPLSPRLQPRRLDYRKRPSKSPSNTMQARATTGDTRRRSPALAAPPRVEPLQFCVSSVSTPGVAHAGKTMASVASILPPFPMVAQWWPRFH